MSGGSRPSGADGEVPESGVSQQVDAADNAKVWLAGRDQYIVTPGNVLWITVPVVLIIASFLVNQAIGRVNQPGARPPQASEAPSTAGQATHAQQAVPLAVALSYDHGHVDNGAGACVNWIVTQPMSAIQAPPVPELDETYAHQFKGIDEGQTVFKIDVQGTTPDAVELIDFRVVDIQRESAVKGTDIISSDGCGPSPEAGFKIGLGSDPPVIAPVAGLDNGAAKKMPFPFIVSNSDIQQFQVEAVDSVSSFTAACNCLVRWRLALDWSYKGKAGSTVIDDDGKPFQTMFPSDRSSTLATRWWDSSGTWSHR